jgi:NurA-like 5'-3' nuclease
MKISNTINDKEKKLLEDIITAWEKRPPIYINDDNARIMYPWIGKMDRLVARLKKKLEKNDNA